MISQSVEDFYFFNILERLFGLPRFQLYSLHLVAPVFLLLSPCLPTATHLSLPSLVSTKCPPLPRTPFFQPNYHFKLEKNKPTQMLQQILRLHPRSLAALGALDQNSQITPLIAGFTAVSFRVLNDV